MLTLSNFKMTFLRCQTPNQAAALCMIFTILLTLWNSEQKNGVLINIFFCFSCDFDETWWWSCSYSCVLQFHQVSSKSDEKQKRFINCLFFCSEFQSVSRIVKIVHSAEDYKNWILNYLDNKDWKTNSFFQAQIHYEKVYYTCQLAR